MKPSGVRYTGTQQHYRHQGDSRQSGSFTIKSFNNIFIFRDIPNDFEEVSKKETSFIFPAVP